MKRILFRGLSWLPTRYVKSLVVQLVAHRIGRLSPEEALRFLFGLDAALYPMWGEQAIKYGGGVHTKERHTRYHEFFLSSVTRGERVLDVGCGSGRLTAKLAEQTGAETVGIDRNDAAIMEARRRYQDRSLHFVIGDVLESLPAVTIDTVVLSNVLEHLSRRIEFLGRTQRELRPGRFLIRVPVFDRHWSVPLKREIGVEWRLDPTHETEYTVESFKEEMQLADLRAVDLEVRWGEIFAEVVPQELVYTPHGASTR